MKAEFIVIKGEHVPLLGKTTATKLGLLRLGPSTINAVQENMETIIDKHRECFKGVGKLKDFQFDIKINSQVRPIVQSVRRLPFTVREAVEKKLQELESMDIIEKVENPSSWVSPLVVVPKNNKEVRICVDMRRANEAVLREHFPIPTVDEILEDMNGAPYSLNWI